MHLNRPTRAVLAATVVMLPFAPARTVHGPAPRAPKAPICAPDNGGIILPKGFCAVVVADSLPAPRHMVVMPNGDLYVSSMRTGMFGLRDTNGDGRANVVQDWGGTFHSSEVAVRDGYLYSDATTAILRFPIKSGSLTASGPADTLIGGLPPGGHSAKTFVIGDDGTLYLNIGSRTNSCQTKDRALEIPGVDPCTERDSRAGIWAFRTDRIHQTPADGLHYGTGIRNSVGMAINPADKTLYVMQHGRDQLAANWPKYFDDAKSAETPAEELFHVTKGDDFGWPYCYFDRQVGKKLMAPEYGGDGKTVGRCASYKSNVASFPGHWAPNGLAFYTGQSFPARYRNGVFIAFHGSWNRAPLPQGGFNVVFQPMQNGKASGEYEVFAHGFMPANAGPTTKARRPTGLAVGPDGSLYIADDLGGRIWRVIYTGAK
jgi:glucose/arabinose dehydrogenase